MYENVGAPTSRNPKGFHGVHRDSFTFLLYNLKYASYFFYDFPFSPTLLLFIFTAPSPCLSFSLFTLQKEKYFVCEGRGEKLKV
jgi:hypothetical protein